MGRNVRSPDDDATLTTTLTTKKKKKKTKSGDDSETLSKLLGPTVVAREERRVQRDVLRDAIVAGLDDGPTTTMLRSERAVETLETSAAAIDREIEAVEAATNDLLVQMS